MKVVALVRIRIGLAYAIVSTLKTHWASQSTSSFLTHSVSAVDLVSLQKSWPPRIAPDAGCFDFSIPPPRGLLRDHRGKEKNWRIALAIKCFKALPWEGPCQLPCPRHCCSFLYSSCHSSPPVHFFVFLPPSTQQCSRSICKVKTWVNMGMNLCLLVFIAHGSLKA